MEIKDRDDLRFAVFLASIALHSTLGTCDRLRVACGIIKNKRLRGVGYNGSVSGLSHCDDVGHIMENGHCIATRHGEVNAISNTNRKDLINGRAIITVEPCIDCVKDLAEEGVREIDYIGEYDNAKGRKHIDKIAKIKDITIRQHRVDWAELFQLLFDSLEKRGGILERAGYRLKITKEPL